MKKPTKPDILCWATMYDIVDLCESDICSKCSHFNKDCLGNREHPLRELHERLHYGQGQAMSSDRRIILISAGKQSGKTTFGPLWLWHQMQICGDGDYLAVSSSFPLEDKKLIPSYLKFFSDIGVAKIPKDFLSAKKILKINGMGIKANIFFGSANNPASLESSTALAAHLDEAGQDEFSSKSYDAVLGRLSRSGGKILISTTVYNLDWLYLRVYLPFIDGDPDYDVIQFESIVSPGFSKKQYEWLKKTLPAWQFDREYRGLFSRPTGMIYPDFNDSLLIDPFPIPQKCNYHVGIDPGGTNTALVWLAEVDKKYYIIDSYLDGGMTTPQHVDKAMRHYGYDKVVEWRGGAGSEGQFRLDWQVAGIHVREPPISDVEAMLDRVTRLLKENRIFIFKTDQNLYSTEKEKSIVEEFRTFSRVLDGNGKPTDRIKDEKKYHKLAALRYIVSGISPQFNSERLLVMSARRFRQQWRQRSGD